MSPISNILEAEATASANPNSRRRAVPRTTAPEWSERDLQWAEQARAFITESAKEFLVSKREKDEFFTTADVMGHIDNLAPLPVSYVRFLHDYDTRYSWVNSTLDKLSRTGEAEVGSTVNARGLEARCYRAASPTLFDIEVEGTDSEKIVDAISTYLKQHKIKGLQSLLITKRK